MRIEITMKSGRQMTVEAEGRIFKDGDGDPTVPGGSRSWWDCDDLVCYWPGKGRLREIDAELYDYDDARTVYLEKVMNDR